MPGAHLQCRCRHPVQLQVQAGRLWLTCAGVPTDHFLTTGQTLTVPAGACLTLGCDSTMPLRLQWRGAPMHEAIDFDAHRRRALALRAHAQAAFARQLAQWLRAIWARATYSATGTSSARRCRSNDVSRP